MEIAVISGKGGTGKSSISAAFATLNKKVVLADCDVDAANLHILFDPTHEEEEIYISGELAVIDYDKCTNCGLCISYCRFDALDYNDENLVEVDDIYCDGCQLCFRVCPEEAIEMVKNDKSRMYSGTFRNGKMVYGKLAPGEENSGKLVSRVREKAKEIAQNHNLETIIIDGPPGIGCAVISSITGVDYVIVVTEPTISGLHDLKRTLEITEKFSVKTRVIINKNDLNFQVSKEIENYCSSRNIPVIASLPFHPQVVEAMINKKSIVEFAPNSLVAKQLEEAFISISQFVV
ncbi:MAG: P-loop NTPase [Mariniphaga sp.]|jgi:MinD superfamily P-loop ATPase|nr:P-loop NTPase [Mariniphaga sp.]